MFSQIFPVRQIFQGVMWPFFRVFADPVLSQVSFRVGLMNKLARTSEMTGINRSSKTGFEYTGALDAPVHWYKVKTVG
jgi:hypothetical protein